MQIAIVTWEQHLIRSSKLSTKYHHRVHSGCHALCRLLRNQELTAAISDLTVGDAKDYSGTLLARGQSPATINRALTSLTLFCNASGRAVNRVDLVEHAPQALKHSAWNAVRRAAEQASQRDHAVVLALVCLIRYAGLRVGEVAALREPNLVLSPRRGTVIVRRGKGSNTARSPRRRRP
jgi:integrase